MSKSWKEEEQQTASSKQLGRHSPQFTPRDDDQPQHSSRTLIGERVDRRPFFTPKAKSNAGITTGSVAAAAGTGLVVAAIVLAWGLAAIVVTSAVVAVSVGLIIAAAIYRNKISTKQDLAGSKKESPRLADSPDLGGRKIIGGVN